MFFKLKSIHICKTFLCVTYSSNAFQKILTFGPKHLFRGKTFVDKLSVKLGKFTFQVKKFKIGSDHSPVILFWIVLWSYITSLDFYFECPYGFTSRING